MKTNFIIVLVTAKDKSEANKIARGLLEEKLVACANMVDGIQSLFWWQGKINQSKETLLVLKTKKVLFKKVAVRVRALHSYQTPEIIALPLADGSKDYLRWIDSSVT